MLHRRAARVRLPFPPLVPGDELQPEDQRKENGDVADDCEVGHLNHLPHVFRGIRRALLNALDIQLVHGELALDFREHPLANLVDQRLGESGFLPERPQARQDVSADLLPVPVSGQERFPTEIADDRAAVRGQVLGPQDFLCRFFKSPPKIRV